MHIYVCMHIHTYECMYEITTCNTWTHQLEIFQFFSHEFIYLSTDFRLQFFPTYVWYTCAYVCIRDTNIHIRTTIIHTQYVLHMYMSVYTFVHTYICKYVVETLTYIRSSSIHNSGKKSLQSPLVYDWSCTYMYVHIF